MSIPRRIGRLSLVAVLAAVTLSACTNGGTHRPASGLCEMDTSRGSIPPGFAIDACVDGSAVWLRNQLDVPSTSVSAVTRGGRIRPLSSSAWPRDRHQGVLRGQSPATAQ
jgi:hypothetical protein